jgi:hypothetical protein
LKELALLLLIPAMLFGARAVMEVAWLRYGSRAKPGSRIGWGPDSIGLPRPIFFATATGLVLAAAALLLVVGLEFGWAETALLVFLAFCALVLLTAMTAFGVIRAKWIGRYWMTQAQRDNSRK